MKAVSRRIREQSGYSMVEVLAAIVILSLAILPMVAMFDAGLRSATTSGNYDKARALANANLERAKAQGSEQLQTDYPPNSGKEYDCPGTRPESITDCKISTESHHLDQDDLDSGTARFKSGVGEPEDLKVTKVTVTVKWSDGSYSASGVVAE